MQCGADVIVGDPLGGSNLIPDDLIECLRFILNYQIPCLLLGGGGYHFPNASRYWCSLTAAICEEQLNDDIPSDNDNFLDFGPDYSLTLKKEKFLKDLNSEEYLEDQCRIIEGQLFKLILFSYIYFYIFLCFVFIVIDNLKYYKVQAV